MQTTHNSLWKIDEDIPEIWNYKFADEYIMIQLALKLHLFTQADPIFQICVYLKRSEHFWKEVGKHIFLNHFGLLNSNLVFTKLDFVI